MRLVVAIVLLGALAGCAADDDCFGIACGAADPPVELRVRGSADASITATRQDGAAVMASCQPAGTESSCTVEAAPGSSELGVYLVVVEAPGYQPVELEIVVEATEPGGCCNSGYISEKVIVDLVPA